LASAFSSVVPVLPAESCPFNRAAVPVPPVITPLSMSISQAAVSAEIARSGVTSRVASKRTSPSGPTILLTKMGGWWRPPLAMVEATVAISVAVDSIAPSVKVRIGCSVVWVMPILCAVSITLSKPTASSVRAKAQFTEPAVAARSVIRPPPPSAFWVRPIVPPKSHGEVPSTKSAGENPFSRAAARVMTFQVDPAWRPG
jgi:hypothetical protein